MRSLSASVCVFVYLTDATHEWSKSVKIEIRSVLIKYNTLEITFIAIEHFHTNMHAKNI